MTANVESMFYEGAVPWHGQGKRVKGALTAEEALKAARLDWEVELQPVYLPTGKGGRFTEIPFNAVVRTKDSQIYQVAKQTWTPIQNIEAFSFFDIVVGEGKAIYHTAGALGKGERIWILAKLDAIGIAGQKVDRFVLLVNGHDGTRALQMFRTPVRVVCQNTLQMAMDRNVNSFYARHTKGIRDKAGEARDILGLTELWFSEFKQRAERLSRLALPAPDLKNYVRFSLDIPKGKPMEEVFKPTAQAYEKILELVEVGRGNDRPRVRGTRWAAYNGVAEYVDHYRQPRSDKQGARVDAIWFGSGAQIRRRAWDYLTEDLNKSSQVK